MKKSIFPGILILMAVVIFSSCKKDYTIGGSIIDPHVNMTTYDYLKTNPLFDTVLLLIDKTGLKDEVNASKTFFAFTDYAITNYIAAKQEDLRVKIDPNYVYTFDSLDFAGLKDSLRAYMFSESISRDNVTAKGKLFRANDGELRFIQLIPSDDYTDGTVFSQLPEYLYFTKLLATEDNYPIPTDSTGIPNIKPKQLDLRTVVQTSGIITTTGILHVLHNYHRFAFFGDENDN
jgi:hypothetical protein